MSSLSSQFIDISKCARRPGDPYLVSQAPSMVFFFPPKYFDECLFIDLAQIDQGKGLVGPAGGPGRRALSAPAT